MPREHHREIPLPVDSDYDHSYSSELQGDIHKFDRRGENGGTIDLQTSILNICKCFCGASSFALPYAFSQAGWLGSLIGVLLFAFLSNFA